MARARIFIVLALLAVGCALLVASYAPRPVVACWEGGGSHAAIFLPNRDNARYKLSSAVITQPAERP